VVLQYARRTTSVSRWMVIAVITIFGVYNIVADRLWTPHRAFTELAPGQLAPISIALEASPADESRAPEDAIERRDSDNKLTYLHDQRTAIRLLVPLAISVPAGSAAELYNVELTYQFPGQEPVHAGNYLRYTTLRSGTEHHVLALLLDKDVALRNQGVPISISLVAAVGQMQRLDTFNATIQKDKFAAPYGGICHTDPEGYQWQSCQFPIGKPPRLLAEAHWSEGDCDSPVVTSNIAYDWMGSETDDALKADFDSVDDQQVVLQGWTRRGSPPPEHMCPGTPITFTAYRTTSLRLVRVSLPPFAFGQPHKKLTPQPAKPDTDD
jgi:hypothetical protein